MVKQFFQRWHFMRILRLGIGIMAGWQGIATGEVLLVAAGAFLALMAVLNAGCCGSAGCAVNLPPASRSKKTTEPVYETVDQQQ
jgi:hypothetical protein